MGSVLVCARHLLGGLIFAVFAPGCAVAVAAAEYAPLMPRAAQSLLLDIARAGERLVAVGERGHILYSDDSARSWTQARVPTTAMLTAVFFIDAQSGWAVGHDGMIVETSDGGRNWTVQRDGVKAQRALDRSDADAARRRLAALGPDADEATREDAQFELDDALARLEEPLFAPPLMDVWFADAQRGIAVGAFGSWLDTRDGGNSWHDGRSRIDNPEQRHLYAIAAADSNRLLVAGESGILLRSLDAGENWQALDSGHRGTLFGALAIPHTRTIYAFGLQGMILLSQDFGEHWSVLRSHSEVVLAGGALHASGDLFLVGSVGTVVHARGDALGMPYRAPRRANLSAAVEAADGSIVAVGQGGAQRLEAADGDER